MATTKVTNQPRKSGYRPKVAGRVAASSAAVDDTPTDASAPEAVPSRVSRRGGDESPVATTSSLAAADGDVAVGAGEAAGDDDGSRGSDGSGSDGGPTGNLFERLVHHESWLRSITGPFGRIKVIIITIVGIITVILNIAAILLMLHPGADLRPNRAFIDKSATTQVISQAQTRICAVLAADGTDVDAWASRARSALTGQALTEFNNYLPAQHKVLEQTKAKSACHVSATAVSILTGSHATVEVNLILSETVNGEATNSGTSANKLELVKKGNDQWLIDKVSPI